MISAKTFIKRNVNRNSCTTWLDYRQGSYYLDAETSNVSSVFIAPGYLRSNAQNLYPFHHLPLAERYARVFSKANSNSHTCNQMPSKLFLDVCEGFLATLAMNANSKKFPRAIEQGWHCSKFKNLEVTTLIYSKVHRRNVHHRTGVAETASPKCPIP